MQSVVSLRLSVCSSVSTLSLNQMTPDRDFLAPCAGRDYSAPEIETQGHRSRSKINAKVCVLHEYQLHEAV